MRDFSDLTEREILALAIGNEEEDGRIYLDVAEGLRQDYPGTAEIFTKMADEESEHRHALFDLYRTNFGDHIPLIRRQDIRGFVSRKPVWQVRPLSVDSVRKLAASMEAETALFYRRAAERTTDASTRKLLGDLAEAELRHEYSAEAMVQNNLDNGTERQEHETAKRNLVLRIVQPALAGLMDGSVSTLAPLFAAAFSTHQTWSTFAVGLAASLGAGISMGFAEALSDNGSLTGRGAPLARGVICGAATAVGGLGHTLPYLIPSFWMATALSIGVVVVELAAISWVRWRYMDTPPLAATFQVAFGGALVFATGVLIGSS